MSEKWKYQVKIGLLWGIVFSVMSILMSEKTLREEIKSSGIYLRLLLNITFGIFILGYFFWKGRDPKNNSWSTLFKRNTKKDK